MKIRLVAGAVVVAALGSLTACGSSQSDTATPSPRSAVTTVVTITRAPTTTPLPTETTDTTVDQTSTLQPAPTTTPVTTPAGGRSDYVRDEHAPVVGGRGCGVSSAVHDSPLSTG